MKTESLLTDSAISPGDAIGTPSRANHDGHMARKPIVIFPMSCRAARVAAPGGSNARTEGGSAAMSASATQPTLRQWSRTQMPGRPSGRVLAQKSSGFMAGFPHSPPWFFGDSSIVKVKG